MNELILQYFSQIGKRGGTSLFKKRGIEYMRKIAKKGGKKSAQVRWGNRVKKLSTEGLA